MSDSVAALIESWQNLIFFKIPVFGVHVEAIIAWMAFAMAALTAYYRGAQFRYFFAAWRLLAPTRSHSATPGASPYKAFATSLSATVGLGNIAGVAIAIALGGPGAVFWMIVVAILAMPLKFTEAALGVMYRAENCASAPRGGPMYYLEGGLAKRGRPATGKFLAIAYVLFALPTFFQFIQVNQAYSVFSAVSGADAPIQFSVIFTIVASIVIFGGVNSVMRVSGVLLPFMCGAYVFSGLIILILNIEALPGAVAIIVKSAFDPGAAVGGVIGVFVIGLRRTVYSTEAGVGAAATFHAASREQDPIHQGLRAMLEPFIDTVIVSMVTALVIVATGAYHLEGLSDIQLTLAAFSNALPGLQYALVVVAMLFAFTTVVSYSYYFERIWTYIFRDRLTTRIASRCLYCLLIFPGPLLTVHQVIGLTDSFFFLLSIPNIIGLYFLAPDVKRLLVKRGRAAGAGNP